VLFHCSAAWEGGRNLSWCRSIFLTVGYCDGILTQFSFS
jgi:hypothetical protein